MSNPPKIDRKSLRTPDEFTRRGFNTLGFLFSHRNSYLPILVGVAVAIGAYYGYDWFSSRKLDKGWRAYYTASKETDDKKWESFKAIYQEMSKSRPGMFAAVSLADHYFSEARKEVQKDANASSASAPLAAEWYGKALDFDGLQPGEKQLLLVNRGSALEMQKKWDEALKDYESAANQSGEGKGWAMLNVGRVWEFKNDTDKAKQAYERVTLEFANSEYAKQAKNYIRRMKSPTFQNPKATNG